MISSFNAMLKGPDVWDGPYILQMFIIPVYGLETSYKAFRLSVVLLFYPVFSH